MSDPITFKSLLSKLVLRENLTLDEAEFALSEILQGHADDAVIGAFLCLLRAKGDQ
jgi:anthranilate phosphoribosyltransferase